MLDQNGVGHLICECGKTVGLPFFTEREEHCFCGISRVDIDAEGAKLVGRREGRYVSVSFGDVTELDDEAMSEISTCVERELEQLVARLGLELRKARTLAVGLGNRGVTHDSLGARVCEGLMPGPRLSVFEVGVSGKIGIESPQLVKAVAQSCGAELIIAVDSLAAKGAERVGRVIQLSDGGLLPGSGVGKSVGALNQDFLGVPVISVGAPTALVDESFGERGFVGVGENIALVCDKLSAVISNAIKNAAINPK